MNNECVIKKQKDVNLILPGIIINCAQPDSKYVCICVKFAWQKFHLIPNK